MSSNHSYSQQLGSATAAVKSTSGGSTHAYHGAARTKNRDNAPPEAGHRNHGRRGASGAFAVPGQRQNSGARPDFKKPQETKRVEFRNDYSNRYVHSQIPPTSYIRNRQEPVSGYPKLQRLFKLKEQQVAEHACKPYGCRVEPDRIVDTLNSWISKDGLQFDVIMIGALTDNQFIFPLLSQLPLDRLCPRVGFVFIWASTQKIAQLSQLLANSTSNKNVCSWFRKFRRSEELIFVPLDKNSPFYPGDQDVPEEALLENTQWHCWMCITGTVRRSTDSHLIHCNVNTDLALENETTLNSAVPHHLYQVAENFSTATRRLHIIPSRTGVDHPVRPRPGWVILSPDVMLNNFDPDAYKRELAGLGTNVPTTEEIELLRPKSPQ
ncbi:unnamed protein product [Kuraishia capsulata CBS 1993]|uniref:Karyogamy protein KAR4 n=1 Tax=Kuraishia capsulata CBS 1993 TaxID=1382522 RepID=W6MPH7_9ASCO|nr:uncharacterized protein KUCA_T00002979001 [Kuraishia capsulata CBS 1993]CDK27002.1 unnamed protein product [Kuraishia capsulata CBS 1993]